MNQGMYCTGAAQAWAWAVQAMGPYTVYRLLAYIPVYRLYRLYSPYTRYTGLYRYIGLFPYEPRSAGPWAHGPIALYSPI